MENLSKHITVLRHETIEALQPHSEGIYLDATFGGGGHSRALLEACAPDGRIVAIDRDSDVKEFARLLKEKYGKRFQFAVMSYTEVGVLDLKFDGAVMDLGLSNDQLKSSGRGFSFQGSSELLDLRFDGSHGQTASQFLNQAGLSQIEKTFREYAQDRYWRGLAAKIIESRRVKPIRTVGDFIEVVGNGSPEVLSPLFQGLRIQVNDELSILEDGLREVGSCLKRQGILAVITFHSLEDRIVKNFFRSSEFEVLTKKPILPSQDELTINPQSRSAKLRVGRKI